MWNKLLAYTKRYPARLSGYISALIIWSHKYLPSSATDLLIPSIIFIIGFSEWSQGVEDEKTVKALYKNPDPNVSDKEEIRSL
jgi:hypothetical protein